MNLEVFLRDLEAWKKIKAGAWIVKSGESALVLRSGKSVWRQKNHATTAFINHIDTVYSYKQVEGFGFKNAKEMAHYIINTGIVKIEQL